MCATALRSYEELPLYPKERDLSDIFPVHITKIGEASRREIPDQGSRFSYALQGLKVIDMTRVLAGPVCGRTLAGGSKLVYNYCTVSLTRMPSGQPLLSFYYHSRG